MIRSRVCEQEGGVPALLIVKEMCLLSSDHCTKLYQQPSGTPCMRVSKLAGAGIIKSSVIVTTAMPVTGTKICQLLAVLFTGGCIGCISKTESTMQCRRCAEAACLLTSMSDVQVPCLLSDGDYLWNSPCGCCQRFLHLCVILRKIM